MQSGYPPQGPGKELPVAPGPAMLTPGGDVVAGRELLDHLDIRGETGAGEDSLQEIVAEKHVFRHPPGEGRLEGVDVVDSLAGVRPLAKEVLIDIRDGRRVGVHAPGAGKDPLKERAFAANRQRGCDARLEDAVAIDDALLGAVEFRPVQRVSHLADQSRDCIAWQSGIGIERDNVTDTARYVQWSTADRHERSIGRAAEKPVELAQLAPLALPSHPLVLARIEDAAPVQQKKAIAVGARPMPIVQTIDRFGGDREQMRVAVQALLVGIDAVRQQRKGEIAAGAAEVVDLQPFNLFQQISRAGQQRRHDDEGAQRGGHARLQIEPGQRDRTEGPCDAAIDEGRRDLGRREQGHQGEERQPPDPDAGESPQCQRHHDCRERRGSCRYSRRCPGEC